MYKNYVFDYFFVKGQRELYIYRIKFDEFKDFNNMY